jgi:hypothetical protein
MAERIGPKPLKTNFWSPNSRVPSAEIKRKLWLERNFLVVDVEDPSLNVSWIDRDTLRMIGTKLYGKRKDKVA